MNRIQDKFDALAEQGRKALIPYIVAGDPDIESTVPLMHALVHAGADVLEIGVPFSDPMAEGPVIQKAHERALEHKTSLRIILKLIHKFRETDASTPVVLMGYANPIEVMGYSTFSALAQEAGVDGVLIVDLPPEEAQPLNVELRKVGLHSIYLIAPTTTKQRAQTICDAATGYIYYVSLKGVTGAGNIDTEEVGRKVADLKGMTSLPVCVGFGIKDGESAKLVAAHADGVVVGSALVSAVNAMAEQVCEGLNIDLAVSLIAEIDRALKAQ